VKLENFETPTVVKLKFSCDEAPMVVRHFLHPFRLLTLAPDYHEILSFHQEKMAKIWEVRMSRQ
jgi:hypothetical protein